MFAADVGVSQQGCLGDSKINSVVCVRAKPAESKHISTVLCEKSCRASPAKNFRISVTQFVADDYTVNEQRRKPEALERRQESEKRKITSTVPTQQNIGFDGCFIPDERQKNVLTDSEKAGNRFSLFFIVWFEIKH